MGAQSQQCHIFSLSRYSLVVCVCAMFFSPLLILAASSDDPYMDELNSEVEDMTVDPAGEKEGGDNTLQQVIRNDQNEESTLPARRQEFESVLHKEYPGTFSYYRQLALDKRTKVFEAYATNPNIKSVRQMVMEFIVGE